VYSLFQQWCMDWNVYKGDIRKYTFLYKLIYIGNRVLVKLFSVFSQHEMNLFGLQYNVTEEVWVLIRDTPLSIDVLMLFTRLRYFHLYIALNTDNFCVHSLFVFVSFCSHLLVTFLFCYFNFCCQVRRIKVDVYNNNIFHYNFNVI